MNKSRITQLDMTLRQMEEIEIKMTDLAIERDDIRHAVTEYLVQNDMAEFFTVNWKKLYTELHRGNI